MMNEYVEEREITIETPVGSITSDSGSALVDVLSIVCILGILFIGKVFMRDVIKRFIK